MNDYDDDILHIQVLVVLITLQIIFLAWCVSQT
jgi:hypothetical protein